VSLSDAKLRALKPKGRAYKVADRGSLYVLVSPAGGVLWRFDYQHAGKRRTLALGRWPAVSLHEARKRRDDAQAQLGEGVDPCAAKQERKRAVKPSEKPTFEESARNWHAAQTPRWTESYGAQVLVRLEADVFPHIGKKRFAEITRADIIETLRRVEARGVGETVRRLRQYIGAVYRFAGAEDESVIDPSPMLRGALTAVPEPKHHAAFKGDELGDFLVKLMAYDREGGEPETRMALQLTLLTAARTMETLGAEWSEFEGWQSDKTAALWRLPKERMKAGDPHMVPLTRQAVAVLRELHKLTGEGRYLFPTGRSTPGRVKTMSNNAMLFALYRMGFRGRATVHGFRRNFSTWAKENGWPSDDVELCLAHDERDRVRGAYNAAQRLEPRRKLLQAWADHLDAVRSGARIRS
jgi:integrase